MAYYGHSDDRVRGAGVRRQYVATLAGAVGRILDTGCRVVLVGGDRVDIEVAQDVRAAVLADGRTGATIRWWCAPARGSVS